MRVSPEGDPTGDVVVAALQLEVFAQRIEAEAQPPPWGDLLRRPRVQSVIVAFPAILQLELDDRDRREGRRPQIVVTIVEERNGQCGRRPELPPIPGFESNQLLR